MGVKGSVIEKPVAALIHCRGVDQSQAGSDIHKSFFILLTISQQVLDPAAYVKIAGSGTQPVKASEQLQYSFRARRA